MLIGFSICLSEWGTCYNFYRPHGEVKVSTPFKTLQPKLREQYSTLMAIANKYFKIKRKLVN
jgi:hypothetical protein